MEFFSLNFLLVPLPLSIMLCYFSFGNINTNVIKIEMVDKNAKHEKKGIHCTFFYTQNTDPLS